MKITWLGQGGFRFEGASCSVMVDPYLSDSLRQTAGSTYTRLVPVDGKFLSARPDVLVITHAHGDHADAETLRALLAGRTGTDILCPGSVYYELRKTYGGAHNLVLFDRGTEWTAGGVTFRAVKAIHSDPSPIGVFFEMDGCAVYVTGDTLYGEEIFADLARPVDILFVCMNGTGNNMNAADAVRFAERVKPRIAVPVHWGLFEKHSAEPESFLSLLRKGPVRGRKLDFFSPVDSDALLKS